MSRPDFGIREAADRDPRYNLSLAPTWSELTYAPAPTAQPSPGTFDRSLPRRSWDRSSLVPPARSSLVPSAPSHLSNSSSRPYLPASSTYPVRSVGTGQEHVLAPTPALSPLLPSGEQEQEGKPRVVGRPAFAPSPPPTQPQSAEYISAWPQGRTPSFPSEVQGTAIRPLASPLTSLELHAAYPVPSVPAQPPAPGARLSPQDERTLAPFLKPRSKRRRHAEPVPSPPPSQPNNCTSSPSLSPPNNESAPRAAAATNRNRPKPSPRSGARPAPVIIDGKKRYPCGTCSETFSTSGHAARHSRIHRDARPYLCTFPQCGARFSRQDNSLQHYKTHVAPRTARDKDLGYLLKSPAELAREDELVALAKKALLDGTAIAVMQESFAPDGTKTGEKLVRSVGADLSTRLPRMKHEPRRNSPSSAPQAHTSTVIESNVSSTSMPPPRAPAQPSPMLELSPSQAQPGEQRVYSSTPVYPLSIEVEPNGAVPGPGTNRFATAFVFPPAPTPPSGPYLDSWEGAAPRHHPYGIPSWRAPGPMQPPGPGTQAQQQQQQPQPHQEQQQQQPHQQQQQQQRQPHQPQQQQQYSYYPPTPAPYAGQGHVPAEALPSYPPSQGTWRRNGYGY